MRMKLIRTQCLSGVKQSAVTGGYSENIRTIVGVLLLRFGIKRVKGSTMSLPEMVRVIQTKVQIYLLCGLKPSFDFNRVYPICILPEPDPRYLFKLKHLAYSVCASGTYGPLSTPLYLPPPVSVCHARSKLKWQRRCGGPSSKSR